MTNPAPPSPARGRGLGCLVVSLFALAFLGVCGVVLTTLTRGDTSLDSNLVEVIEERPAGATGKLVVIEASGVLIDGDAPLGGGRGLTRDLLAMLERARRDDSVSGVLLHLDTPGGAVTDADLIHAKIRKLREAGREVVVLMGDLCASGGYYVAVAADEIYALHTTVTGSIGVIIAGLNLHELLERHGIRDASITSGANKALLSPTRPIDPEHQALLQNIVDEMHARFVKLIAEGRELSVEAVQPLADGRLFTATQAKAAGLVDEIGYREDALDGLRELAGGGPFEVVRYVREPSLADLLRAYVERPDPQAAVLSRLMGSPRAMYLFSPQAW